MIEAAIGIAGAAFCFFMAIREKQEKNFLLFKGEVATKLAIPPQPDTCAKYSVAWWLEWITPYDRKSFALELYRLEELGLLVRQKNSSYPNAVVLVPAEGLTAERIYEILAIAGA